MLGLINVAALAGAEFGIKANANCGDGRHAGATTLMGKVGERPEARAFSNDAARSGVPRRGLHRERAVLLDTHGPRHFDLRGGYPPAEGAER